MLALKESSPIFSTHFLVCGRVLQCVCPGMRDEQLPCPPAWAPWNEKVRSAMAEFRDQLSYLQLITPLRLALCLIAYEGFQNATSHSSAFRWVRIHSGASSDKRPKNVCFYILYWTINHSFAIGSLTSKQWSCTNDQCWLWRIANHCLWYITHILSHILTPEEQPWAGRSGSHQQRTPTRPTRACSYSAFKVIALCSLL